MTVQGIELHPIPVDAYMARVNARAEAAYQASTSNPSPATLRVRALRARRAQERQA